MPNTAPNNRKYISFYARSLAKICNEAWAKHAGAWQDDIVAATKRCDADGIQRLFQKADGIAKKAADELRDGPVKAMLLAAQRRASDQWNSILPHKKRKFDENEPRDDHGKWTVGGDSSHANGSLSDKVIGDARQSQVNKINQEIKEDYGIKRYNQIQKRLTDYFQTAIPCRYTRESTLLKVLETGRFKTQYETKSSTVQQGSDPAFRRKVERKLFPGYESRTKAENMPIYGLMRAHGEAPPSTQYGGEGAVIVDIKRHKFEHDATVTWDDSLNRRDGVIPMNPTKVTPAFFMTSYVASHATYNKIWRFYRARPYHWHPTGTCRRHAPSLYR